MKILATHLAQQVLFSGKMVTYVETPIFAVFLVYFLHKTGPT